MTQGQQGTAGRRDAWVDYGKAIGIVLVVYGHVARGVFNAGIPMDLGLYTLVDSVVYSFHMPLFFFLSGVFFQHSLNRRGPLRLAANKVDTILWPYLLWSIIQGLVEVFLSQYTNGDVTLTEVFTLWDPRAQFWFLYALFLVILTAILVYRTDSPAVALGLLILGGLAYCFQAEIPGAMHSDYVVKNFVFFALGVWFNQVKGALEQYPERWAVGTLIAFILVQYWFHGVLGLVYTDRGLASLLVAVISIICVVSVSILLARRPRAWVLALGTASMAIYLMHILAGSGARIILSRVLGVNDALPQILVGCLVGILVPMLVLWVIDRLRVRGLFEAPARLSVERWYDRHSD